MKKFNLFTIILLFYSSFNSAQPISNYYPIHVGDHWTFNTDSLGGEYNPSVFYTSVEGTDLINGEEYFRLSQYQEYNSGTSTTEWFIWIRGNSTGGIMGAFGTYDTMIVFDEPILSFPNEANILGYEWEYDMAVSGDEEQHWKRRTESLTATVETPAGTFDNCMKITSVITDNAGDTTQIINNYYANGIGEVMNEGTSDYMGNYCFKLTEYFVGFENIDKITVSHEDGFLLYFDQSNPLYSFQFTIQNTSGENLLLNLQSESTDSTYLLYCEEPDTTSFNGNIWRMRPDGSDKTQLTFDTLDFEPRWSPDGSKIVFHSLRSGSFDIWVMDADGSNIINLTSSPSFDRNPDWSPDGNFIIFDSDRDNPMGEIYRINSSGGDLQRLTINEIQDARPCYSPNGDHFVTNTRFGSNRDILVYSSDGMNYINIGRDYENYEYQPSWTPDGKRVVWACGNPLDIVSSRPDGSDFRIEFSTSENDYMPVYSPDGQFLSFAKSTFYPSGGDEIFVWNKNLNKIIQVTDNTPVVKEWGADWSPFMNSPSWVTLDKETLGLLNGMSETVNVSIDLSSLPFKDQTASIMIYDDDELLVTIPINIVTDPSVGIDELSVIPDMYELYQNYPNPFNPSTTIKYNVGTGYHPVQQNVQLIVYDVLGREVVTLVNEQQRPGNYEVEWNAKYIPSGVYFYKLQCNEYSAIRKMLLIK